MKFNITDFNTTKRGFCAGSTESFPIGGGDCGANVWLENDGALNLLLSKSDTFAESSRLLKLGYLKIKLEKPVFSDSNKPVLTLDLSDGAVHISDEKNTVKITVAAFIDKPLYGVKTETTSPNRVIVTLVNYRSKVRELLSKDESAYTYCNAPFTVRESADVVPDYVGNCLSWYHHNKWSYYAYSMVNQHLTNVMKGDPVLNRIFGCAAAGKGFENTGKRLESKMTKKSELFIVADCAFSSVPENWTLMQSMEHAYNVKKYSFDRLLADNKAWWTDYFTKYFVNIYGTPEAVAATKGYTLQKYMLGCAGRGKMPIKFNGSIFTVHPSPYYEDTDWDYRRWGDPFWIQNTRLIYWDMLYSGDFEGMKPFFDFMISIMPEARERARVRYNCGGINIPETVTFFGTFADSNYGYNKDTETPPICDNTYIRWYYTGQLEISYMMLKFREFSGGKYDAYFESKLLPFIEEALLFFKERYPKVNGKIRFDPVSSLETWQNCIDDTPNIAGILAIIRALKRIGKTPCIDENELPAIPHETREGREVIAPCAEYIDPNASNCETTELYTAFPFDIYTFDMSSSDRELLTATFETAQNKFVNGWSQRNEQAAIIGMTDFCKENVVKNFGLKHEGCFFDAYFGPNFDWTPDQCHGSSTSVALIFMLLQSYEGKVKKYPAFPAEWKAEFRLPSSAGTVEEIQ